MRPEKAGQIAKFQTPLDGEDPSQLYVVIEVKKGGQRDRADIQALGTGLTFPGINTVMLDDLMVVAAETADLLNQHVSIQKTDGSEIFGVVTGARKEEVFLDMSKNAEGVMTNVWLSVCDEEGVIHEGTLIVR